jgi:hypothetical protein
MQYTNLLDLARRSNNDVAVGLIEDSFGVAPELQYIPVRTVTGSTYNVVRRTALPSGGFRNLNEGRATEKSTTAQEVKSLLIFDLQMAMDKMAPAIEDRSAGDIMTDEATGAFRGAMRTIGTQFYYGVNADAKGFIGIGQQIATGGEADAAGGTDGTSLWVVWPDIQGVHFVVSDRASFEMSEWRLQSFVESNTQIERYVASLNALIGLNVGSDKSVFRVKGIKAASSANYLTDALGAELRSKIPTERLNGLVAFGNSTAILTLQKSRSAVGNVAANRGGSAAFAPEPDSIAGIPIIRSDMILDNETGKV